MAVSIASHPSPTARRGRSRIRLLSEWVEFHLPDIDPHRYPDDVRCPRPGCGSGDVLLRQVVPKTVRDPALERVFARRYGCLRCGHTFRVYPLGIGPAQATPRLRQLALLLYLLGLSYGEVPRALRGLGLSLSKTAVYLIVRDARPPKVEPRRLLYPVDAVAPPVDEPTALRWANRWLAVTLAPGAPSGGVLRVDLFEGQAQLLPWLERIAGITGIPMRVHFEDVA